MNRAPDTRLSEALMRLNRTQRAALVRAVSGRFLREAAGDPDVPKTGAAPAAEAPPDRYKLEEVPTGEVIKDGRGNPAFEKTDAGWKSVIKVPLERILMLVKEANRETVGKLLKDAAEGEDLTILLGFLADTEDKNTDRGLRLKKVDGMFMDPVSLTDVKIKEIADLLKYQPPVKKAGETKTAKVELGPDDRIFNNIIFKYDADKSLLKVIVDLDKGGTAQLKRLLGTDAAVSKADEKIAATKSGQTVITLDTPVKGSTLFSLTEKPVKLKAPAFRYLPVKQLLVLDVPNVDQTLWETLAQKLDVGKETKKTVGPDEVPIGITYSDLRSMKAGQIVEETIIDNNDSKKKYAYAKKVFADVLYIIPREVEVTNLYSDKKQVTSVIDDKPIDKIYTNKSVGSTQDFKVIVGLNERGEKAFRQVFTYESLIEALRLNVSTKRSENLPESGTKSITYRITDPEEEI